MELTKPVLDYIMCNYKKNKVYVGHKIKNYSPKAYGVLSSGLDCVPFEKADTIIDHDVIDFCKPIIISNSRARFSNRYNYKSINKACDVAVYYLKDQKVNDHLVGNCYRLNENKELFDMLIHKNPEREAKPITDIAGTKKDKRCLIVGGGPSWKDINYDLLADDVEVMVVNYNFDIKCNYQIFTDKSIADDLRTVRFKDNRKLIGNIENLEGQADYSFSQYKNVFTCLHTGAYAVQVAKIMGYDKIYLIGFDYTRYPDGKDYYYKKRSQYTYKDSGGRVQKFIEDFNKLKAKNVWQLNPDSKLKKYPTETIGALYATN
jgi:hypothetical protein